MSLCEILCVNLKYLESQVSMRLLANKFNRTESTICNVIAQFCKFFFEKQGELIKWPVFAQVLAVAYKFCKKAIFPLVLFLPSIVVTYTLPSKVPQYWNYKNSLALILWPPHYLTVTFHFFVGFLPVYIIALYFKIHHYYVK
jgi:hypothetical protein